MNNCVYACVVCMYVSQDYSTLLRDYRVFYVKLPTLEVHPELVRSCVACKRIAPPTLWLYRLILTRMHPS